MKKIITTLLLALTITVTFANDEAYRNAMKENIKAMESSQNPEELQAIANTFERIAKMAPSEWLPVYYASLTYIRMGIFEKQNKKKDAIFDKAKPFLDQAIDLAPTEGEVILLEGYWHMMKLTADPVNRSQTFGPRADELFNQAQAKNSENPRVYLMKGHMEFGTAQFFGNSTENACALFRKSLSLYDKAPSDELAPSWGKGETEYMITNCK